jgi:hypothetical protein
MTEYVTQLQVLTLQRAVEDQSQADVIQLAPNRLDCQAYDGIRPLGQYMTETEKMCEIDER